MSATNIDNNHRAACLHERAIAEKRTYLQFIHRLGKSGIQRFFTLPGSGFSLWWSSLVVEKSPLKSDAYQNIISHLVYGTVHQGIRKRFKGSVFYHLFRGILYYFQLVVRQIKVWNALGSLAGRASILRGVDYTLVSYFPHINKDKAQQEVFENRFLGPFHRTLALERPGTYAHICIPVDIDGYGFDDAISLVRGFSSHEQLFLVEEFISGCDMAAILGQYLMHAGKYLFGLSGIRKSLQYASGEDRLDAWRYLCHDFNASFCGAQLLYSLFYSTAFKKITALLKKESTVVTISEMQAWERCLYYYSRKNGVRTIAYQHSIVPLLLLNYFDDPVELQENVDSCPQPDFLATVGATTAGLFLRSGWSANRVFIWGAQRFESLQQSRNERQCWSHKENLVVCAFSISPLEAEHILIMLRDAFPESADSACHICLKSHPSLDVRHLAEQRGIHLSPSIFEFTDTPLDKLMVKAKAMIVTESSATFYAIAAGCRIIIPRFDNRLDCNPLSYLTEIGQHVDSACEMKDACLRAVAKPLTETECCLADRFLNDYFYFPATPSEYLNTLEHLPAAPLPPARKEL